MMVALAPLHHVQAAIGGWHCLALSDEGQVYSW
jgi:alpha-tubulin suppressor-like RCC1 family protein